MTIKDAYPIPRVDESLDQLSGSKWFSCLDLSSGYWQVEVDPVDKNKTAFQTRQGLFEFNVMTFGLCNAPATFERLMETVLSGLHWQICLIYLDDIIILGKDFDDMLNNLDTVFQRLSAAGLKLKAKKCSLFAKKVEFLGHIVSEIGIETDPKKTECIRNWSSPTCTKEVRSFIGLCSYYRKFIENFSAIAKPIHRLCEKNRKFLWTKDCEEAFRTLKQKLVESPVLCHPDFSKSFILDCDASHESIGAILSQNIDGKECVIAYASRTLTKCERKYCVTRKELLALVHFVKYFRHYLYGKNFLVRTDHGSLRWLMNFKSPEGQVARWIEILSAYDMKIEHRPGRLHSNADAVSRIPCKQCGIKGHMIQERNHLVAQLQTDSRTTDDISLHDAQQMDENIKTVIKWINIGERPSYKEIGSSGYFLKSLWTQWTRLSIQDNLLVRKWEVIGTDISYWQAIVPLKYRIKILKFSHDIKASGHLGIRKTLSKIRQRYYWPGLQNDVRSYVSSCEACLKRKNPNKTLKAPMQINRSGYPMERIAIDILGPLPETEINHNRYVLVIADYFTKWTECFAISNIEASTVAKTLVEEIISRFGVPSVIHSDQGKQFESLLFQEMCKLLQIEKTRTTPYHPSSDGLVERFNKTLMSMVGIFVKDHHRDWDEQLPYVMMAYRATVHESTGMSPNFLMLGRETSTPLDIAFEMPPIMKTIPTSQWAWILQEKLELAHSFVREYTGNAIKRQKMYHDTKLSFNTFEKEENVFVYFPVKKVGCSSKLTNYWRGPFKITEKISDVLYKVNCGQFASLQVIHVNRLKKARKQVLFEPNDRSNFDTDQQNINDNESISDFISDNDQTQDDDENDEVLTSKFGRRIKKPSYLKDYVCSICRMASCSKDKSTKVVCAVCKMSLALPQYEEHILKCIAERPRCDICGKTLKKEYYAKLHKKRQHEKEIVSLNITGSESNLNHDTEEENVIDQPVNEDSNTEKEEASDKEEKLDYDDIGSSPDVSIAEELEDNEISCDENNNRISNDTLESSIDENKLCDKRSILEGRIIRKSTKLYP